MEGGRRYQQHVEGRSQLTRMMSFFVVVFLMIPHVSSMLFQSRTVQNGSNRCLPGMDPTTLTDMASGLSNRSNIFDHLLPNVMIPRVSGTAGNVLVREFIKREMRTLGWVVQEDRFLEQTPFGQVEFCNVIATFNPSAARRLVIACHYDSKYMPGSRIPFVGAIDSAVPCSIMMDTAKQLNQVAQDAWASRLSDFSLQFIFFDGEEAFVRWTTRDSLYGSRHLAGQWESSPDPNDPTAANNLQNIVFFTLLDLIGTRDTRFVNYYSNTLHLFRRLANIEQCLLAKNLLTRPYRRTIFDPHGRSQLVEDDHIPFVQRGVPVLHLISTPFPTVWHTLYDNLNYLDPDLIDDFSRIFRVFLTSLLVGL